VSLDQEHAAGKQAIVSAKSGASKTKPISVYPFLKKHTLTLAII
jgi:hypothetical protein